MRAMDRRARSNCGSGARDARGRGQRRDSTSRAFVVASCVVIAACVATRAALAAHDGVPWGYASPFANTDEFKRVLANCLARYPDGWCDCGALGGCGAAGNEPLEKWNTNYVTDMSEIFKDQKQFNYDISRWNTYQVTSMKNMFYGAESYNNGYYPLSEWDTAAVTDMSGMFAGAKSFNQKLFYRTGLVNTMESMFENATAFNADVSLFQVMSVTSMKSMFAGAVSFDQELGAWDVSYVSDMSYMFKNAGVFQGNGLGGWQVGAVTSMREMFSGAMMFQRSISNWATSSVQDMTRMFANATSFSPDELRWDVGAVTSMREMFKEALQFRGKLGSWNPQAVTDMHAMFSGAWSFDANIEGWATSRVKDMSEMFKNATSFNGALHGWTVGAVTSMREMFSGAWSFNQDISDWRPAAVTDMTFMFADALGFNSDMSGWDTSSVKQMFGMFLAAGLFNSDLSKWSTSNVLDMSEMFKNATAFNGALNGWDVSAVTSMREMFLGAVSFNQYLDGWRPKAVQDMSSMFQEAFMFNSTLNSWTVPSVTTMANMFSDAYAFNGDISAWDTRAVTDMTNMFKGCADFNQDITVWNTQSVKESTGTFTDGTMWAYKFMRYDNNTQSSDGPPGAWYQWCSNAQGVYARIEDQCVPQGQCQFEHRCIPGNEACLDSQGDFCLDCADKFYRQGDYCYPCPDNTAATAGVAGVGLVLAGFLGFKASATLGAVSANCIKKVVESFQYFSISFSISISWPEPIVRFATWLQAFDFNIDFMAPECAGVNMSWYFVFWSTIVFIPALATTLIVLRVRYAEYNYQRSIKSIRGESIDGRTMYWISRPGFCGGERRAYASENGDKLIKYLQKQYRFGAVLRMFGTLLMTLMYLPIIRMCLQSWDCSNDILIHDTLLRCDTAKHEFAQAMGVLVILVFGGGLPIWIFFKVRQLRDSGKLDDAQTLDRWGNLYEVYRREELTRAERVQILNITAQVTRATSMRQPSMARSRSIKAAPKVEVDDETQRVLEDITQEQQDDAAEAAEAAEATPHTSGADGARKQSGAAKMAGKMKSLARKAVPNRMNSMFDRSASARGRDRVSRMTMTDRLAINYLSVDMLYKLFLVLVGTTQSAGDEDRWSGVLIVHWSFTLVVIIAQPWRAVTVNFGLFKLKNALNRVEIFAGFLQGCVLIVGYAMEGSRLKDLSTAFLISVMVILIGVRVLLLGSITVANKIGGKWNFIKDPAGSMELVAEKFVELAKQGAVVRTFTLKNSVAHRRYKARARLEAAREGVMTRIKDLDHSTHREKNEKEALYALADTLAHEVNSITVADPPEGLTPDQRLTKVVDDLDAALKKIDEKDHVAVLAAYEVAIKRLDAELMLYARAEMVPELTFLAQGQRQLLLEHSVVALEVPGAMQYDLNIQ